MDSSRLIAQLSQEVPAFSEFVDALRASSLTAWLVGGCIRDLLLGRQCADVDVVCIEDPSDWARSWAKGRGHWFWLDQQRRHSRILLPEGVSFDVAPLRAPTIEADLLARDFTVNALAVPIGETGQLLDPLNGIIDLSHRCLRICSDRSFSDDPLRILKGARHAAVFAFSFDEHSLNSMSDHASLINNVAAERVRDELFALVNVRDLFNTMQTLSDAGVLVALFGSPDSEWIAQRHRQYHRLIYDRIDDFCHRHQTSVVAALQQQQNLFLLSSFLRTYSPTRYVSNVRKLRLSREQQRMLKALQSDMTGEWLTSIDRLITERRLALAVEQLNPCGLQRVFYWGWCIGKIPEHQVVDLLEAYWTQEKNGRIPHLLDGHLIAHFVDHHQIGKWQHQIKLQEIEGRISHQDEALVWLKTHLPIDKN